MAGGWVESESKGFGAHWNLPVDIGGQQQKKSARFVPKWPSYVNFSVFLRWRVAAGNVILSQKWAKIANDQYLELNGEP